MANFWITLVTVCSILGLILALTPGARNTNPIDEPPHQWPDKTAPALRAEMNLQIQAMYDGLE